MSKWITAAISTPGKERPQNEDAFIADDKLGLYAVADGVAGSPAGEVASAIAIATVRSTIAAWREDSESRTKDLSSAARLAIERACAAVFEKARSDSNLAGMATTLSLVLVDDSRAAVAHVGHGSVLLLRGDRTLALSVEHTIASELARAGAITTAMAAQHPMRATLTRAVGLLESVLVDTVDVRLLPGDALAVLTDGAREGLTDESLHHVAAAEDQPAAAGHLEAALSRDSGQRDSTAVVAKYIAAKTEHRPDDIAVALQIPALRRISSHGRLRFIHAGRFESYNDGDELVTSHAPLAKLIVVLSGTAVWSRRKLSDQRLSAGQTVGSACLLRPGPFPGELRAQGTVRTFEISTRAFRGLARRHRLLGLALTSSLADALARRLELHEALAGPVLSDHDARLADAGDAWLEGWETR